MSEEIIILKLENLESNLKDKIKDILKQLDSKADKIVVVDLTEDVKALKGNFAKIGWAISTAVLIAGLTLIFKDGLI